MQGVRAAGGEWLSIFDSDDEMTPDRLERLVRCGEAAGADIVADNLWVFSDIDPIGAAFIHGDWASRSRWIGLAEFINANRLYSALPDLGYLKPLLRRAAIDAAALGYDESLRIGEDYDFITRLLARGLKFRFEPAELYRYRKHPGSISHRSRAADFQALLAANDRFAASEIWPADVAGALRRRHSSLETSIVFDRLITDLKAGSVVAAVARALGRPGVWPLMLGPVVARVSRLAARGRAQTKFGAPLAG